MARATALSMSLLLLAGSSAGQGPPEILYFQFNEGGGHVTANTAVPGQGSRVAAVAGLSLDPAPAGQFGDGCLGGVTTAGALNFVDTGWPTALGGGDWSVACWLDMTAAAAAPGAFMYVFGDPEAGSLRCYTHGAAGVGNIVLRGPFSQVVIPQGGSTTQPVVVMWVHDSTAGEIRGYLDGVPVASVPQGPLSINGAGFRIGAFNGTGSFASLQDGVLLDEFRLYSRALSDAEIAATWNVLVGTPLPPVWQVNHMGATLAVDDLANTPFNPLQATLCAGEGAQMTVASESAPNPWDLAITSPEPGLPVGGGAVVLGGGQIINIDLAAPSLTYLNGLTFTSVLSASFSFGFSLPAPADISAQMLIVDPSQGSGLSLSALNNVVVRDTASVTGPTLDDHFLRVPLAALCGPPTLAFAGTSWTDLYVNSNGSVGFGQGNGDFSPSVAEFAAQEPRLAGMWTDLDPGTGGTITTSASGGVVTVSFQNVPPYALVLAGPSSVDLVFDTNTGACSIQGYVPGVGHALDTLIGLSPGNGATDPGPRTFSALAGAGPQSNLPTDAVYELALQGAPAAGWTSIVFVNSDPTSWVVN